MEKEKHNNEAAYQSAERQSVNENVRKDAENTTGEDAMGSGSEATNSEDIGQRERELDGDGDL